MKELIEKYLQAKHGVEEITVVDYDIIKNKLSVSYKTGLIFQAKNIHLRKLLTLTFNSKPIKEAEPLNEFKVGDRVWCLNCGWGTVIDVSINNSHCYPVHVSFNKEFNLNYTRCGKLWKTKNRSLYSQEMKIVEK